ncbi:hypothetical protein ACOMHN_033614 [Nucella lapillus]
MPEGHLVWACLSSGLPVQDHTVGNRKVNVEGDKRCPVLSKETRDALCCRGYRRCPVLSRQTGYVLCCRDRQEMSCVVEADKRCPVLSRQTGDVLCCRGYRRCPVLSRQTGEVLGGQCY